MVHNHLVEGVDGCFYVGRSVAERNEDVICARRSRVGKRSRDEERGDLGAKAAGVEIIRGLGVCSFEAAMRAWRTRMVRRNWSDVLLTAGDGVGAGGRDRDWVSGALRRQKMAAMVGSPCGGKEV